MASRFPNARPGRSAAGAESKAPPDVERRLRVFVVEDSPILSNLIVRMLESDLGVEVLGKAGTADEAIAALRARRPDVVVVDLALRVGSGFDVLRWLRHRDGAPLALVLTNLNAPPYREAAAELGVGPDRFFDKTNQIVGLCRLVGELARERTGDGGEEVPGSEPYRASGRGGRSCDD